MKLKHDSTTCEYPERNLFDFSTYGCLTTEQRDLGREPFSSIKTVLVEHMQEHFPGHNFIRPQGQLVICIPLQFHTMVFCEYYDELAYQLVLYHQKNSTNWTKDGMKAVLKQYPLPADINKGIPVEVAQRPVQPPIFEKPIDLGGQVHLPRNLLKTDFKNNGGETVRGRSKPSLVFFPRKKTPTDNKKAILKESSETSIILRDLIVERDNANRLPVNIVRLLNQQLGAKRDQYTADKLYDAFHECHWMVDRPTYDRIKIFAPVIHTYIAESGNAARRNLPEREKLLRDKFQYIIKKERTQAAIAGLLNRILLGPAAPKIKYIYDPSSPDHLKLLSRNLPNSEDYVDLTNSKPQEAIDLAPQLATAAIVRLILGCIDWEMILDNFMCVSIGNQKRVVNIDTDNSFDEKEQSKLKDLTLGIEGAKNLCSVPHKENKQNWDQIFTPSNNEAVQKSMLEMLQRAAAVLTEEMIHHIVKFVTEQDHEVFSLLDTDKAQMVDFLKKSRTLIINKLTALNAYDESEDALLKAPWLKDMFEEINHKTNTLTVK